jgi:alginate O-acetyltransferase complex protein AlgI
MSGPSIQRTLLTLSFPSLWMIGCRVVMGEASQITGTFIATSLAITVIFGAVYLWHWKCSDRARKRVGLGLSLGINLSILGFFKYYDFFRSSLVDLLEPLGLAPGFPVLAILLPVGISFYTFQSLSYVIDVYRGETKACRDLLFYSAYISFFPQLVAGPIERSRTLLPQILKERSFAKDNFFMGCRLILVGYFKKVFIGDNCALLANYAFSSDAELNGYWALLGILAFTFQIYGDFSGYTDIARGSAKLFGIELNQNFKYPYFASSPSDFWRRWHISLSAWFRDYVYISLGGNRGGNIRTLTNLTLTMFLAGLWHGAAWMFIIWGLYHGLLLVIYRIVPPLARLTDTENPGWLTQLWSVPLMFLLTILGWTFFRSASIDGWLNLMHSLTLWDPETGLKWVKSAYWLMVHTLPLILLQILSWKQRDEVAFQRFPWPIRGFIYVLLLILTITSARHDQEFIYFQF